jgi:hypothetical protein
MKYLLIFLISFFSAECNSPLVNNNCKEINMTMKRHITSYYEGNYTDTQSIEPIIVRWSRLSDFLCSKVKLSQSFCIVEISGKHSGAPEGLVYIEHEKKFYYFKRNGKNILLKLRQNEMKDIHSFILTLVEQPKTYLSDIISKNKNVIVDDAPSVSILMVDLLDDKQSFFFSIDYSDYIFGTRDK